MLNYKQTRNNSSHYIENSDVDKPKYNFFEDVELDAKIVFASMNGGQFGLMEFASLHLNLFPNIMIIEERCKWLKNKSKSYIKEVSELVAHRSNKINK